MAFSLTRQRKFTVIILQISHWSLSHCFLLLIFPWCRCCYASWCLKGFLSSSYSFKLFFSVCCSAWVYFSTLSSKCWFEPLLHLTYCLLLSVHYLFHILHSLFLAGHFVLVKCLFSGCWVPYNHCCKLYMW